MDSTMEGAALVYKATCAQTRQLDLSQLTDGLSGQIQKDELDQILGNKQLFISVCGPDGKQAVIARTQLRLCRARNCSGCLNLHLCKFYLLGEDCPYNRGRRVCRVGHDLYSDHNSQLLRQHYLQELGRVELCTLLLQNDSFLLPQVCFTYNRGTGEFGYCPDKDACRRLHICQKYLRGTCNADDCDRSHDFYEPHPIKTLQARGMSTRLIGSLLDVYRNILAIYEFNGQGTHCRDGLKDTEICLLHIKNSCKQGNRCGRVHFHLPYRWEFKDGRGWSPLTDNEAIEQDYCDPLKTYSGGNVPVHFDTMTRNSVEVRRISTASSVTHPSFILTTTWAWHWEDEFGNWTQYASSDNAHHSASITSEEIEKRYQENNSAVIEFTAGKHTYELSMQDMIQLNKRFGTKRLVRRRPVFVSAAEVQKIKSSPVQIHRGIPCHWDKSNIPETGFKRVKLTSSSDEYRAIDDLFSKTMSGFTVTSIERVQNRGLWEVFQWQAEQMRKNNSGNTNERILFHGTDSRHIDCICQQNFDWRICGTHGTAYGKGSYFARDSRYSHKYTSPRGPRSMFACRVLLGEYTKGSSSYVRPPPKENDASVFYDSCVNHISDPSIFVVFEKHQVYPEYLIQYTEAAQPSAAHVSQNAPSEGDFRQSSCHVISPSSKTNLVTVFTEKTVAAGSAVTFSAEGRSLQASARASEVVYCEQGPTQRPPQSGITTSAVPAKEGLRFSSSSPAKRVPVYINDTTPAPRSRALPGTVTTSTSSLDGYVKSVSENTLAGCLPFGKVSTSSVIKPSLPPKPSSLSHSVTPKQEISGAMWTHSAVSEVVHTLVSCLTPHNVTSMESPSVPQPGADVKAVSDRTRIMNPMAKFLSHGQAFADSTSMPMQTSCFVPGEVASSEIHTHLSVSKSVSPSDDLKGLCVSAVSPLPQNVAFISNPEESLKRVRKRGRVRVRKSRTLSSPNSDINQSVTSQNSLPSPSSTNISHQAHLPSRVNDPQLPSPMPRCGLSSSVASDTTAPSSVSHEGSSQTTELSSQRTQRQSVSDLVDYFHSL